MICDKCGTTLQVGFFPFCKGRPSDHEPQAAGVVRDEIPGGQWVENLGHEPVWCDSQSAIRKVADSRGLRLRDCWAGPGDKHLSNWAAGIDAYTLESARRLLERGSRSAETPSPGTLQTLKTEIVDVKRWSDVA